MWSCRVIAVVASIALAAGCSSDKQTEGEKRATSAASGLKETRAELAAGRAQIDKMIASMNALRDDQGNLQTEFATFNTEVKNTEAAAAKTRDRAASMRARSAEYQTKWRQEMATVDDPTLRAAADARVQMVRERFDSIKAKAAEGRTAYDSLMKQLKSLQTYLSNDLTAPGIKAVTPVFDKATADAKTVNEKLDAVIAELDSVSSAMPGGQPAKK
jgi:chromosome segregation ATPase